MSDKLKALEFYRICKSSGESCDFTTYENRWIEAINDELALKYYHQFRINSQHVLVKSHITKIDDYFALANYEDALKQLVDLVKRIVSNTLNIQNLNHSGFYDRDGKLDLRTLKKVQLVTTRLKRAIKKEKSSINRKLEQSCSLVLLHKNTLTTPTHSILKQKAKQINSTKVDKIIENTNNYYLNTKTLKKLDTILFRIEKEFQRSLANKTLWRHQLFLALFAAVCLFISLGASTLGKYANLIVSFLGVPLLFFILWLIRNTIAVEKLNRERLKIVRKNHKNVSNHPFFIHWLGMRTLIVSYLLVLGYLLLSFYLKYRIFAYQAIPYVVVLFIIHFVLVFLYASIIRLLKLNAQLEVTPYHYIAILVALLPGVAENIAQNFNYGVVTHPVAQTPTVVIWVGFAVGLLVTILIVNFITNVVGRNRRN